MEPAAPPSAPAVACRWAGSGRSAAGDSAEAGAAATRQALDGRDDAPALLLVFAADAHDPAPLLAGVHEAAGDVPLIGATALAPLDAARPADNADVVLALGGDGLSVSTDAVLDAAADPRDAGARAAACLGDVAGREHRVLLLLADGCVVGQADILRGAYSVAGAGVPIVGGAVGDSACARRPAHLHGPAVVPGGA